MALTIPTAELTGLLSDVLAFMPTPKDDPFRGVLIAWDSEADELSASAYDVLSGARSTWVPGEGQEGEVDDEDQNAPPIYGGSGNDPSWQVFISADDAKEIVKVFKLPAKKWWVPVTIKVSPTGSRLTVERTGDHGPTEALLSARTIHLTAGFPDIEAIGEKALSGGVGIDSEVVPHVVFSPYRLAAFGTVRAHGPLSLVFTTGATVARMGDRFQGFIFPNGIRKAEAQASVAPGRAFLQHGSGVHVSAPVETQLEQADGNGDDE